MASINATTSSGIVATADNTATLQLQTAGTNALNIDASQNVGIGTASPTTKLDVTGLVRLSTASPTFPASGVGLEFYYDTPTDMGRLQSYSRSASAWKTCAIASGETRFETGGTERMRIDSSGNVGIGTSSPASYGMLAVNGSIAPMGAIGTYSIDVTLGSGTTVSSGGTVNFSNASGMLVVNQYNNGAVTIYLCGGGVTTAVASVAGTVGSFAYNAGIGGYTWTSSNTTNYGFFFLRTRPTA